MEGRRRGLWSRAWVAPILLAALSLVGCRFDPDPTDDRGFASVSFLNDTDHKVELFDCGDGNDCHSLGSSDPGDSWEQEVSFGTGTSLFQVRHHGQPKRWLVLSLPRHTEGSVYWIGDASASRTVVSPDHGKPHLKPKPAP